jgi:hypothetical protein
MMGSMHHKSNVYTMETKTYLHNLEMKNLKIFFDTTICFFVVGWNGRELVLFFDFD